MPKYTGCRNLYGPLRPEITERLDAYFKNPDEEHWNDVSSIIIGSDGWMTFWQAVSAVDPTFPMVGPRYHADGTRGPWPRIPDAFTARRALKHAQTLTPRKGGC